VSIIPATAAGKLVWCTTLALAIVSAASVPAQTPVRDVSDRYAIGAVKSDIKPNQRIGSRRAGLVCLPAGSFKWSDARSGMSDARDAIASVLHTQMPEVVDAADDPFSEERGATRYKIIATLEDVSLNACIRNWGLAAKLKHNHALSGRGHVAVTWEIFDRTTRSSVSRRRIATDFDLPPDVEDAAAALTVGFKINTGQFAREQWPAAPGK
jgi:hypothetical protein